MLCCAVLCYAVVGAAVARGPLDALRVRAHVEADGAAVVRREDDQRLAPKGVALSTA